MAQLLIRGLETETLERLKALARRHGRSLQGEVKVILIEAAMLFNREARAVSGRWHKRLAGRIASDSAKLIRQDRNR